MTIRGAQELLATRVPSPPARRKRLFTLREAAEYLAISYWTVRSYVEAGKLPACRLPGGGRLLRIAVEDLDRLVDQAKDGGPGA